LKLQPQQPHSQRQPLCPPSQLPPPPSLSSSSLLALTSTLPSRRSHPTVPPLLFLDPTGSRPAALAVRKLRVPDRFFASTTSQHHHFLSSSPSSSASSLSTATATSRSHSRPLSASAAHLSLMHACVWEELQLKLLASAKIYASCLAAAAVTSGNSGVDPCFLCCCCNGFLR
jgi:hypothetical protein